jgi:hypothetical protein
MWPSNSLFSKTQSELDSASFNTREAVTFHVNPDSSLIQFRLT